MNIQEYGLLKSSKKKIALIPVTEDNFNHVISQEGQPIQKFLKTQDFKGQEGKILAVPNSDGDVEAVFVGVKSYDDMYALADMPSKLPDGNYYIGLPDEFSLSAEQQTKLSLGWALGTYKFTKYKSDTTANKINLVLPSKADIGQISREASAFFMVRDLINRPANDLTPAALEAEILKLCAQFNIHAKVTKGAELESEYTLIHTVGKAADEGARLVDFCWGDESHPKITLVGKGLTYDTGGLDKKPSGAMNDMRSDMGGAANVMGLAKMIMESNLPVRLRVLIPIAENAIDGHSMRPHDIVYSKKLGKHVKIGHTDAEGRIVLSEALAEAASEKPDIIINMATLTGASKRAVGVMPVLFSSDKHLARNLMDLGEELQDPMWQMPLVEAEADLASGLTSIFDADIITDPDNGNPDHIMAALFLKKAIGLGRGDDGQTFVHVDFSGFNSKAKPGRPEGGNVAAIRTLYQHLQDTYTP